MDRAWERGDEDKEEESRANSRTISNDMERGAAAGAKVAHAEARVLFWLGISTGNSSRKGAFEHPLPSLDRL
jgi:hypothetical protein